MLEVFQNHYFWILFFTFQIGLSIYLVGNAKGDDETTDGTIVTILGSAILTIGLIASIFLFKWQFILILVLAFLTKERIAYPIAYIYWKATYKPNLLTLSRFTRLISNQDKQLEITQKFRDKIDIYCDIAIKEGLVKTKEMESYVNEVFTHYPRYIAYEVFYSYDVLEYYLEMRSKSSRANTFLKVAQSLGMIKHVQRAFLNLMP